MTKAPQAGRVKTRLTPPLTPDEAAALNVCFLRDTAGAITRADERTHGVGVYTPIGSEAAYRDIFPDNFYLVPQRGDAFGERLNYAVDDLLTVGFQACCLIDSDSPTVTTEVFRRAAAELLSGEDRIVLGPSDDGGYYLIGTNSLHRQLFERIDWSTERVFTQTIDRAREIGIEPVILPTFYDIDERATLRRLCSDFFEQQNNGEAPATRAFLAQLIEREGRERIWPQ
jgi:rSAM/selenodomain-associated transferase 1